ncbi:MAG: tRNA (uridine(34)/cytosine(34)/5-carboxymethylaminomethyluridine(34)-2'-O)-methyltransferase TrmL [Psittacicella sp.]
MINIVLYEPEIPQNTGNIIRLCANIGAKLHLIEPFGYIWDDKKLKRAGLDYHGLIELTKYANYQDFLDKEKPEALYAMTTKGSVSLYEKKYEDNVYLMFGPESRGLPKEVLDSLSNRKIRIPMVQNSRSMNLSNSVAVAAFEVWRQMDFVTFIDSNPIKNF